MNNYIFKLGSNLTTLLIAISIFMGLAPSQKAVLAAPILSENSTDPASQIPLEGTSWILVDWSGENSTNYSEITEPITANFIEGNVKGSTSCNRYIAAYKIEDNQLKITPNATTTKACMGDLMDREFAYLKALEGVQQYEINDQGQLEISYTTEAESGIMTFAPQESSQLEDKTWVLASFENGSDARIPLGGSEITVNFTENQVSGFGSCNEYRTDYTKEGNKLSLNDIATTRKACPGEIMRQEFQYLTALEDAQWYEITPEGQLKISYQSSEEVGIMTFVPQQVQP